jgi:uncharacterized protein
MDIHRLKQFCQPFYHHKDIMHDLTHIRRVLKVAYTAKPYKDQIDEDVLTIGAYLHGMIDKQENRDQILNFLKDEGFSKEKVEAILVAAEESDKKVNPNSLEGKILHDAHLLEGGKTFLIVSHSLPAH